MHNWLELCQALNSNVLNLAAKAQERKKFGLIIFILFLIYHFLGCCKHPEQQWTVGCNASISCLFDFFVECYWLVPIPEKHTAADVISRTNHPQTADSATGCARPRLPTFQLYFYRQQFHTCTGICALQT